MVGKTEGRKTAARKAAVRNAAVRKAETRNAVARKVAARNAAISRVPGKPYRNPLFLLLLMGALIGALIALLTPPALAQGSGGLVISSLPSDIVIGSAPADAAPPVQLLEASLTPMDPALAATPATPRAGLPRPSIIVGDMAVLAALGPRGPLGMPFQLREAIRQRDAALFERLLGRGVFDPDPDRMAEAIQTELQRAQCYAGGIDGEWGSGSARAVERWRQAASSNVATDPQPQLFRAIARGGDLRCAAVAAPVAVVTPTSKPRPGGNAA